MALIAQSTSKALKLPFFRSLSPVGKTLMALGTYVAWTALTWLLEGRIQTFLRPEAVTDRLIYTGLANIVVGTILGLLLVREFVASDFTTRMNLGFRSGPRTIGGIIVGGVLGFGLYVLQQPATTDPIVIMNVFAQVLPVSIAEVVVCYVVVGGSIAALLRNRGVNRYLTIGSALVVSSVLFGVYHFAHSPPFNTVGMVGLLTVVGVGTGLIYFVGGSFYGALVFHNFMALFGIVTSLAEAGQLATYQQPLVPLLATALVALTILVGIERLFVKSSQEDRTTAADA
ncbi:type II CAAX prenyl endopeptidase Rce1 family protein [Salinirubellus sp. GCM10025818]|uniref:type II CAAX prenyl endopeptidase Rce1 family protein n=1 Tax=Salinirubellus TaxID=2162630 RepID=UPI0030D1C905